MNPWMEAPVSLGLHVYMWMLTTLPWLAMYTYVLTRNVSNVGIIGKLPDEIGNLPALESLDISNAAEDQYETLTKNVFTGPLPASLGLLTHLKIL